jgi:hypothetical protein
MAEVDALTRVNVDKRHLAFRKADPSTPGDRRQLGLQAVTIRGPVEGRVDVPSKSHGTTQQITAADPE